MKTINMKTINYSLMALVIVCSTFTSCTKSSTTAPTTTTNQKVLYSFNRGGTSTVNFSEQTIHYRMLDELSTGLTMFSAPPSKATLDNMFTNTGNPFSDNTLNTFDESIRSKVAASKDYFSSNTTESERIKMFFETLISNQVQDVFANKAKVAAKAQAGQLANGSKTRYVDGKGYELNQQFKKGMMGALLLDQIINNYLSLATLDEGTNVADNNSGKVISGKSYTKMEHAWDEAYGYLVGSPSVNSGAMDPSLLKVTDSYLFHYLKKVSGNTHFSNIDNEVFQAFAKGRKAIVDKDYTTRNAQIAIIKSKLSLVIAVRAIHYLQEGKTAIDAGERTSGFHPLSEGSGFVYSLRFTQNSSGQPYFNENETTAMFGKLIAGDGAWDVTSSDLDKLSSQIATKFNITVEQAK